MLLHRNIGSSELIALVRDGKVHGTYDITNGHDIILDNEGEQEQAPVVCFFASDYWWIDDDHTYEIWVDIPDFKVTLGKGIYYANKDFDRTHVWNGRKGDIRYEVPEAYVTEYSVFDIRLIKTAKKPITNLISDMAFELGLNVK